MERGANIGMRNLFEETPISLILPETMEQFLDEHCLTSKGEVGNIAYKKGIPCIQCHIYHNIVTL